MEDKTHITREDIRSYLKVEKRCNELAEIWFRNNGYNPSAFDHTCDIEVTDETIYFSIVWRDSGFDGTEYKYIDVSFSLEEFMENINGTHE